MQIDTTVVRNHYAEKKGEFAKKTYLTGKYGDKYGYKLADPYTEKEISEYEEFNKLKLPADLREYLTKVSRELFMSGDPIIFTPLKI